MGFPLLVGVFVRRGPRNSYVVLPPGGRGGGASNAEQTFSAAGGGEVESRSPSSGPRGPRLPSSRFRS